MRLRSQQSMTSQRRCLSLLAALLVILLAFATPTHGSEPKKPAVDVRAIRSAADVATAKGDVAAAIKLWTQVVDAEPSQINYFQRASALVKKHQYSAALADLGRAMALDPKFVKGQIFRARVLKMTGACDAAQTEIQAILAAHPAHKEALVELPKVQNCVRLVHEASAQLKAHQWKEAKDTLTAALDIAYDSNSLMLQRVQCHTALGDWQSVLVDTRRVLQSDKSSMDALLLRGRAYYYLGEHEPALTHWKEGLRLDPEHKAIKEATKSLRLLTRRIANAEQALQHNRPAEALEDLDAALAHDPSHAVIRPGLLLQKAQALNKLKRWAEAIGAASQVLAQDENNVDALLRRAEAKMGQEQWEQAIADYSKATQINQGHHEAQQGLHRAQAELKRSQQKDYYKELGIPRDANARAIKKAYLKQAMVWHPDKHEKDTDKTVAEKKFQAIAEAYEVLSTPEYKQKYDAGEEWRPNQGGQQQQQQHGGHPFHHFHQQHHQQQHHFRWG